MSCLSQSQWKDTAWQYLSESMPHFLMKHLLSHATNASRTLFFFTFPRLPDMYAPFLFLTIFHQDKKLSVTLGHHNLEKKTGTWTSWNQKITGWWKKNPNPNILSIIKRSRGYWPLLIWKSLRGRKSPFGEIEVFEKSPPP